MHSMLKSTENKTEIIEGNKLIADFMGWIHHKDENINEMEIANLQYHSSWDWIMPVVKKIAGIMLSESEVLKKSPMRKWKAITIALEVAEGEALWLSIVDFIKWYNQNLNNG
jgi:hypothetical protein